MYIFTLIGEITTFALTTLMLYLAYVVISDKVGFEHEDEHTS